MSPSKLGKYELEPAPIGQGAMGVVYKAFDPDLRQPVAVKVIRKEILAGPGEDDARRRFKSEAIAGRRLRHPNIVPVYDYGEEHDCSYIVMEFVEGRRLKDILDSGCRFSIPEAVSIMEALLDALQYAHRQNVVHRDIKPANILYSENGQIQVADFGIAKIDASTLTRTGAILGTPGYMAPEQCQGTPSDHRADLFAAGVILYELLTGEQPFRASTGIAAMEQVLSLEPAKPSHLNAQVPLLFDDIVAKAMAERREERYQSAREFASTLKRAVEHRAPLPGRNMTAISTVPGTARPVEPQRPRKTREGLLIAIGLVAVVAVALMWSHLAQDVRPPQAGPLRSSSPSGDGSRGEAASRTTEELVQQLRAIVAGVECAELEPTLTAFQEVVLTGYLKSEDRERVESEIAQLPGVKAILFKAEMLAWPYCQLRQLLGAYQAANSSRRDGDGRPSGVRLTPRRPDAWYQEGEHLVLTLTAPDFASYLYVDYFMLDGSVVHQFPVTASQRERQAPFKDFPLGESGGAREWQVAPPFGNELLVAIATQDPLFAAPRPEMDISKDYLPALAQALLQVRSRGSLVLAYLQPITTSPTTQAEKPDVPKQQRSVAGS